MSTDETDGTSANDLGGADDLLSPMEATDSDDVRNADGDEVVDPPDDWTGADKFGMSAQEQREGDSLDHRLAQEEPDVDADMAPGPDAPVDTAGVDSGRHRGQVDGAPEDGESLFPVVDDATGRGEPS
ncbi:hypothetical protein V4U86_05430 [Mycobacterium sp. AMU20-3851]|uniref:hypothetical protein n=1 Tax=Mycobacterium sp. AMU20-3851 TaxID=3122055 RepID=UPI003753F148